MSTAQQIDLKLLFCAGKFVNQIRSGVMAHKRSACRNAAVIYADLY